MPTTLKPIRRKLMTVILLTSAIAMLLTAAASVVYEFITYRQAAVRNLTTLGEIVATNSTAALAFDNVEDATSILSALRAERYIVAAALYDQNGQLFASYVRDRSIPLLEQVPEVAGEPGRRFVQGHLIGVQPVIESDRRMGTLFMKSTMEPIYQQLRAHGLVALLVMGLAGVVAYLISRSLQRQISGPILALAETARAISHRRDYSVRATAEPNSDELAALTHAFNHMLDQMHGQFGRLHLLQHITRAIGERQDLPSIFNVVLQSLEDSMPVDFAFICRHDASEPDLTVDAVGPRSAELARKLELTCGTRIPIDQNGLSSCIAGKLVYDPDTREVPAAFPQRLASERLHSLVIAPLSVENHVFGVLVASRRRDHAFESADCEFLRHLSEHVALAAHQAQLYGALQQAYDDLRQTQHTVMQQERLRALGQMASGIAHDINNAISPVALYTESLLEREPSLSERARGYLQTIQRAIEDVAGTVARMREFYRPREPQLLLARINLNRIVPQVIELTRARWSDVPQQRGVVVELKTVLDEDLPDIMGAEGEIRDALTNLIFNAVDAMPEGGVLTLRTRVVNVPGSDNEAFQQACIEVADTGVGMDEETRRRCLEPFFTTKGERGTGLGLAMVYGMVQRHSAELEIDSEPGKGTTMRLLFAPFVDSFTSTVRIPVPQVVTKRLRILIVDDDPLLIKSLQDTLEADGHIVTTANGGQAGIDAFTAARLNAQPFAVVVTDLGMPYVDGRKVAAAIKAQSADTPVILLTGWGHRLLAENDIPPHVNRVLNKPPRLHELRAALAELTAA